MGEWLIHGTGWDLYGNARKLYIVQYKYIKFVKLQTQTFYVYVYLLGEQSYRVSVPVAGS